MLKKDEYYNGSPNHDGVYECACQHENTTKEESVVFYDEKWISKGDSEIKKWRFYPYPYSSFDKYKDCAICVANICPMDECPFPVKNCQQFILYRKK